MAASEKEEFVTIVLIKSYWEGFLQSVLWLAVLALSMAFAVWIGSSAMQWVMAIFWFVMMIGWAGGNFKKKRFTPEDAISEINKHMSRGEC